MGGMYISGANIDTKNTSSNDIIAKYGVHKGTHATDRGSVHPLNLSLPPSQTEKKPYANQLLHLEELEKSRQRK
jgi:hypothetical protein